MCRSFPRTREPSFCGKAWVPASAGTNGAWWSDGDHSNTLSPGLTRRKLPPMHVAAGEEQLSFRRRRLPAPSADHDLAVGDHIGDAGQVAVADGIGDAGAGRAF